MFLDRLLVGAVYAFVYSVRAVTFVIDLPSRLMGTSTTKQDAMTRRAVIEEKARRRWIHDVQEAERFYAERARRLAADEHEHDDEFAAAG